MLNYLFGNESSKSKRRIRYDKKYKTYEIPTYREIEKER